ncbi:MAG: 2Fe-2S iron-sulfur cluster-binding protein [Pseudomonadota bacterium]
MRVQFEVNGEHCDVECEPRTHLADVLRDELGLTGTHLGCEHGVCGACTVLIDGDPMRSCLAFAPVCVGKDIRTIEGFPSDTLMNDLRDAFHRHHALQCGYCTSGFLITAYDIVRRLPDADEDRIREELAGNLCRCTGYVGIVRAISDVVSQRQGRAIVGVPPGAPDIARYALPMPITPNNVTPGPTSASSAGDATRIDGGGADIRRELAIEGATPEALWQFLQVPANVVSCLPGASIDGDDAVMPLAITFVVTLGPIRASFAGEATVSYDESRQSGRVEGSGNDRRTRTRATGHVVFGVHASGSSDAVLSIEATYQLAGPLAQFARGAVVDALVDRILESFAVEVKGRIAPDSTHPDAPESPLSVGSLLMSVVHSLWSKWRG